MVKKSTTYIATRIKYITFDTICQWIGVNKSTFIILHNKKSNKRRPMTKLPYHWSKTRAYFRSFLNCAYRLYKYSMSNLPHNMNYVVFFIFSRATSRVFAIAYDALHLFPSYRFLLYLRLSVQEYLQVLLHPSPESNMFWRTDA